MDNIKEDFFFVSETWMCLKHQNKRCFCRSFPLKCKQYIGYFLLAFWEPGSRRAALPHTAFPARVAIPCCDLVGFFCVSSLSFTPECFDLCILSRFRGWQAATLTLAGPESSSSGWVRSIISHCSTSFLLGEGSSCKADLSQLPWALNKKGRRNNKWISTKKSLVISRSDKPFRLCFGNTWTWLWRSNFDLLRIKIYECTVPVYCFRFHQSECRA